MVIPICEWGCETLGSNAIHPILFAFSIPSPFFWVWRNDQCKFGARVTNGSEQVLNTERIELTNIFAFYFVVRNSDALTKSTNPLISQTHKIQFGTSSWKAPVISFLGSLFHVVMSRPILPFFFNFFSIVFFCFLLGYLFTIQNYFAMVELGLFGIWERKTLV